MVLLVLTFGGKMGGEGARANRALVPYGGPDTPSAKLLVPHPRRATYQAESYLPSIHALLDVLRTAPHDRPWHVGASIPEHTWLQRQTPKQGARHRENHPTVSIHVAARECDRG